MSKLPFMQFYPSDWIRDTQVLNLAGQGAWIKLICAMWIAPERGRLEWRKREFEHYLALRSSNGLVTEDVAIDPATLVADLDSVADIELRDINENVAQNYETAYTIIIQCRRMLREETQRKQISERVKRHRNALVTQMKRPIYHTSEVRSQKSEVKDDSSYKNTQSQKNAPPSAGPSADFSKSQKGRKEIMGRPVSADWSPELKAVSDAIYYSDKVKFKDLVKWIMQGKKHGYPESELIATLKKFWDYREEREDWYAYLDTILLNVHQDFSRDQSEREHRRQLEELKQMSRNGDSGIGVVVRGIADAKKA